MNFKKFNIIFSFIFSVIFLLYNLNRIPSGMEMGALIPFFFATTISGFIYIVTILISIVMWKINSRHKNILQIVLFLICVSSVYFSSWLICVYEKPPLTSQEIKELNKQNKKICQDFYNKIPEIINKGYVYKPSDNIYKKDSLRILNSIKYLIDRPLSEIDSVSKIKIANFLDNQVQKEYYFEKENEKEILINLKTIINTLKIRNIFYSPINQTFITFISYTTKSLNFDNKPTYEWKSIALFGVKQDEKIYLYEYNRSYDYDFIENEDLAYSFCFMELAGFELMQYYYSTPQNSFLEKSFWSSNKVLKNTKYKNQMYYGFQFCLNHENVDCPPIEPLFILLKNEKIQ